MTKFEKRPPIIVKKTARGLSPVMHADADELVSLPMGTEFDLIPRTKRSHRQLRLYWGALHEVVRATGLWPTAEHLHDDLKLICGYSRKAVNWDTGEVSTIPDSTAFNAMRADEFRVYFDTAMKKLAEHVGYDPLAFAVAA